MSMGSHKMTLQCKFYIHTLQGTKLEHELRIIGRASENRNKFLTMQNGIIGDFWSIISTRLQ